MVAGTQSLLGGAFLVGGGVYRERLLFERGTEWSVMRESRVARGGRRVTVTP
jgi:hypothetical protein